jgi:hypothetical protein
VSAANQSLNHSKPLSGTGCSNRTAGDPVTRENHRPEPLRTRPPGVWVGSSPNKGGTTPRTPGASVTATPVLPWSG